MTYAIRPAEPADIAAMNRLGSELGWHLTATDDNEDLLPLATADAAYVCVEEREIIGWVYCANRTGWEYRGIDRLLVHPAHRNQGIARALVQQVLDDFPHEEVLIAAWDRDLRNFYEKLGFRVDNHNNMTRLPRD
ncbi:GNAT family N-acetyltransferase [Streptomyces xiamenensis]|uniref:GNAT family N-acetyltransferase n=1 Tax=Streptomyces xiamenensis TaxID=408015 RepID=UPI0036ED68A5